MNEPTMSAASKERKALVIARKRRILLAKSYLWFLAPLAFCGYVALWIFAIEGAILITVSIVFVAGMILMAMSIEELSKVGRRRR